MAVKRPLKFALCCFVLTALPACTTGQSVRPEDPQVLMASGKYETWSDAVPAYRISEGDHLHISFPLTPELDQDILVRPDGAATLKAAGELSLAALWREHAGGQ